MATESISSLVSKTSVLLVATRNPRIQEVLVQHGFQQQDYEEGWTLLRSLGNRAFFQDSIRLDDKEDLKRLDDWENKYFPIADSALARRFPAVHEQFFKNLTQQSGHGVLVSVATFLQRFDALGDPTREFYAAHSNAPERDLPQETQAKELLVARGLNTATLEQPRAVLAKLQTLPTMPTAPTSPDAALDPDALRQLAGWYREWASVLRANIRDRRLLILAGLRDPRPAAKSADA